MLTHLQVSEGSLCGSLGLFCRIAELSLIYSVMLTHADTLQVIEKELAWQRIRQMAEEGALFSARVESARPAGLIVKVFDALQGFVPGSHVLEVHPPLIMFVLHQEWYLVPWLVIAGPSRHIEPTCQRRTAHHVLYPNARDWVVILPDSPTC